MSQEFRGSTAFPFTVIHIFHFTSQTYDCEVTLAIRLDLRNMDVVSACIAEEKPFHYPAFMVA